MPGLIDQGIAQTEFDPAKQFTQAKTKGYDPTLGTVDLDTDTVSGQLDKILSAESPYITRARAGAAANANNRGLLNSSIAAGAGEAAAIDAALPIASQDASTFSTQRLTNQAAGNTASQFNAGATNTASLANAGAANQRALQELAGQQNLGSIAAQGAQQRQTAEQTAAAQSKLQAEQGQIQGTLSAQQAGQAQTLEAQRGEIQRQLQTADAATRASLLERQGQLDTQMQELRGKQIADLAQAQAGDSAELQKLRGQQAQALADTEAAYKAILQTSASASQLFSNSMAQMTAILQNTETSAEAKEAALTAHRDMLRSGLAVIGSVGDVDLESLLDFD